MNASQTPLVSIVVPLYNAEHFLPAGIQCIREQSFTDWELVAVNDGSSDATEARLHELCADMSQPLVYKRQENAGGFGARNTGLDLARGRYIALFDIDDLWFPHHLEALVSILETHSDIDWVYAANQIKDLTSNSILAQSSLYENGKPKEVLKLEHEKRDAVAVITDEDAIACQILHGLWLGQQFSLFRREVFQEYRFISEYRNEAADQLSVVTALNRGFRLAYTEDIHGIYHIHTANASAGCKGAAPEKYIRLRKALIRGYEEVCLNEQLSGKNAAAVKQRVAREYFWNLGYNVFLQQGERKKALECFIQGLKRTPLNFSMWKTYLINLLRSAPEAQGVSRQ